MTRHIGAYRIQFHKLAQKLTTIPPADTDSHKSAGMQTDPPWEHIP
jgi:hypothetical protein